MSIEKNLAHLLESVGPNAQLVVVSKEATLDQILEAYRAGVRDFGESRLQDALPKIENAPKDIRWHFIGRLQKNKVAKVVGTFALIHSVDTLDLAEKISEVSLKRHCKTPILLEANTSGEHSKAGLTPSEWKKSLPHLLELQGIEIHGLMTMAPLTSDESVIRKTFSELRHLRDDLQDLSGLALPTLSMGMSHDYLIALQEGATLLRIGTLIFSPHEG